MISPNPNIRKLNLSHKDLTEIPDEVYLLKQLRVLDLSYNNLTAIPEDIFKLPHLRTLVVSHNHISSLPFALGKSSILDLIADYNNVDFILPITLIGLRKLIISHNRLNIGLIRTPLPSMHHLDIRHNPAIQFADRPHTLPNILRYYHDPTPTGTLMPDGMQYYHPVAGIPPESHLMM